MKAYKVRDADGTVIAQYYSVSEPSQPSDWDGEWNVENVSLDDLNTEPVEWWDEQF
ncbi:hypothetical protein [Halostagnicola sp. A-GB9-2]|uniref:hypothetical protein n=1 Tax=Halostagnicola sp. A-GB9-2 TaxID=3048066 RepID=UPI0024C0087B|nr:hypothetical protein [Halostagnicola sp. A-GB9-2]MDJ1431991.1 hypothetical protein [Halostagnicola sp. A-GB9-2]